MDNATPAPVTLADLLALLDLTRDERGDHWRGGAQQHPEDRVFGGLLLAQALVAAGRTTPPEQRCVSLQADFVSGVPTDRDLVWEVSRVSEAASLSTRRSTLRGPDGAELFSAVTRWATTRDDLPSHGTRRPADAGDPELLPGLVERFGDDSRVPPWWRTERPVHLRHADPPPYVATVPAGETQTTWLRTTGPLPADPVLHAAVAAYATDMSILEPAFRALGSARHAPGSRILSLTHTLTFHAQPDLSDWHQLDARVEAVAHGRCLGSGDLFDATGRHVATASQLGLVKLGRVEG